MNETHIHPALRQADPIASPPRTKIPSYSEGPAAAYSSPLSAPQPSYPQQQQQHQHQQHHSHHHPQQQHHPQSHSHPHQQQSRPPSSNASNGAYNTTPNYYPASQSAPGSPEEQSPSTNPADPNDLKRPRACEACRSLKVKCELDDSNSEGSCKRCAKARRPCIVTQPNRKRQKKTDSRVAELEKKIDALTATLAARGGVDLDTNVDPAITHEQAPHRGSTYEQWQPSGSTGTVHHSPLILGQGAGAKRKPSDGADYFVGDLARSGAKFKSPTPAPAQQGPFNEQQQKHESHEVPAIDVVASGLMDAITAYRCFDRYTSEMCHQLPLVVFAPSVKAEDIRRSKPILFLSIVAVSAGTIRPDVQSHLISEVTRILADRILVSAEKSLELVQAIQVLTVFYQPPERYEEMNFNQLTHMAAVMALDLGMGKRSKKGAVPMWNRYLERTKWLPDPAHAETRRCWLGIYYMCSNSAMSLRRPLLIRWSSYADECLQVLASAKDALPTDQWLCHLVKAQHLGEEIGVEFGMDDPASSQSLMDPGTQRHLKSFEKQLEAWHDTGGDMIDSPIMKHTEATLNLYMHEIAMHHNHNIDDFRPPYYTTPIDGPPDPDSITPAHIESLTKCLHSAHQAFDAFLSMDLTMRRALPTHFFVRSSYAAVALIKLYSSVAAKGSKFSSMFTPEDLKVDEYLDRMITSLKQTGEGQTSRVALKFALIFTMLKKWHVTRAENPDSGGPMVRPPPQKEKQHRSFSPSFQPSTTSQPSSWSSQTRPTMEGSQPPNSGLQMLSESAMAPGRPMPPQTQQGQWIASQHQMGQMQSMHPSHPGMAPMAAQNFGMMAAAYGMMPDQMMINGFGPEGMMQFGFGDDFMNMGFDPQQWQM